MHTREVLGTAPSRFRCTVEGYFNVPIAIDDLLDELSPKHDPSRWNPFIAATTPGGGSATVVAPTRCSGAVRLTGRVSYPSDRSSLLIDAAGGPGRRGLRITHEIELIRAGSFHTTAHLTTTKRGRAASLVSRRRIADWHVNEIYNLRTRAERKHARPTPTELTAGRRGEARPLENVPERVFASASTTTKDTCT